MSILVYAGVGSGYSVWMLVRCMVSNVLAFASVIVTLNSAVLLVAWMDCCVCVLYCSVEVNEKKIIIIPFKQHNAGINSIKPQCTVSWKFVR